MEFGIFEKIKAFLSKSKKGYLFSKHTVNGLLKYGDKCKVNSTLFEGYNVIMNNVTLFNCSLGLCSYVNSNTLLLNTKIGKFCSIANNVQTCTGNHPTSEFVSTFPAFYYNTKSQLGFTFHKKQPLFNGIYPKPSSESKYQITIGNDVWIASNVLLLGGVKIGDGAVVAAGAVVASDVPPYAIVGGCPAKVIKYRFKQDEISRLLAEKWWNLPLEEIAKNYLKFSNIKTYFDGKN